jgi:hypothetical protein
LEERVATLISGSVPIAARHDRTGIPVRVCH